MVDVLPDTTRGLEALGWQPVQKIIESCGTIVGSSMTDADILRHIEREFRRGLYGPLLPQIAPDEFASRQRMTKDGERGPAFLTAETLDDTQQYGEDVKLDVIRRCWVSSETAVKITAFIASKLAASAPAPALANAADDQTPSHRDDASAKRRGGGRAEYDWPDVQAFVFETMNERGDLKEWDAGSGWQRQEDLNKLVKSYISETHDGREPTDSNVRRRVRAMLEHWRAEIRTQVIKS